MPPRAPWFGLAAALGVFALAASLAASDALSIVRRPVSDWMLRVASERAPAAPVGVPDVALVAIDAQSLRAQPDWPWPRSLHARVVRRLHAAGARAIGIDVDYSAARDPAGDADFAAALRESGRVALGGFRERQELAGGAGTLEIASLPRPEFAAAASAIASLLVPIEPDGIVRSSPRATEIGGELRASLPAASLAIALGELPRPRPGSFRVDYRRARPPIPTLSIADVIDGRFDARDVAGRVVLVGATAAEFQDLWSTPLGPARPGVWIQAVALRTLAAEIAGETVLREPARAAELALLGALSLVCAALGALSHARRTLGLGLLALGAPLLALEALVHCGWLVDPVIPVGVVGAHYALGLESIRHRFGRSLARRELSLSALLRVGEATVQSSGAHPVSTALALLGDVVGASGVALYKSDANGELDGEKLEWSRDERSAVGDREAAASALTDRRVRVFQGRRPGPGGRGAAVYAPLVAGTEPVGVLVVERASGAPLADVELRTIATVGTQLALAAQNARLLASLRQTFQASIEAIASAVEARDGYTELHCRRLAAFSVRMATRLGLPEREVEAIRLGALLHDVGKIGIRDEVLLKAGRLSDPEREEMRRHPEIGRRIVSSIPDLGGTTVDCIVHHHEWWDGNGYPHRLAGPAIPLGARIVSVVDVWDALSTSRPYKRAYPQETVRLLLRKGAGAQFDPELCELFLRILDEEGEEMVALLGESARPAEVDS